MASVGKTKKLQVREESPNGVLPLKRPSPAEKNHGSGRGVTLFGGMAQLVEHRTVPAKVTGSSPVAPATLNKQNKWKQLNYYFSFYRGSSVSPSLRFPLSGYSRHLESRSKSFRLRELRRRGQPPPRNSLILKELYIPIKNNKKGLQCLKVWVIFTA